MFWQEGIWLTYKTKTMMQRFDFKKHNTEKNHFIYTLKRQFPSIKGGSLKKNILVKFFFIHKTTKCFINKL